MAIPNWLTGVYRRLTTRPSRPRSRSRRTEAFAVSAVVETLERRTLLSSATVGSPPQEDPSTTGLQETIIEPMIHLDHPQIIYVDTSGSSVDYNGPVEVKLDVPKFDASAAGLAGHEAEILSAVLGNLASQFAGTGVQFTLERPAEGTAYSTIYVGGTDARFRLYGDGYYGLAESNDFGNAISTDEALVFSDTIIDHLEDPSFASLTQALKDIVGHETYRLVGQLPPGVGAAAEGLDAVAAQSGPSLFQYPIVPAGGDGRSGAVVTQHFGEGFGTTRGHLGTDIRGSTGTAVHAIADGKVTQVIDLGYDSGWGKVVIIEHRTTEWGWDKNVYSMYAHVDNITVAIGQYVHRGDVICQVGPTAKGSTGPHLHLEVRSGTEAWWRAGPGYLGHDFNRLSSTSVTRPDYPNLKWYDPEKLIAENLYSVEVWTSKANPAPGEMITVYARIPISTLPQNNGKPDLTNVAVTFSIPGLSTQSKTVNAASPDKSNGQGAILTSSGYLEVSQRLLVDPNASIAQTSTPRVTISVSTNTPVHAAASQTIAIEAGYSNAVQTFIDTVPVSSTPALRLAWLQNYAQSMHPDLLNSGNVVARDLIVEELAHRMLRIEDNLPASSLDLISAEEFQDRLDEAFGTDRVHLHGSWDPHKPTVVLVHGVNTTGADSDKTGNDMADAMHGQANVISFYWGNSTKRNGDDRRLSDVISGASSGKQDDIRNLEGSVNLHLLITLLNRVYGSGAAESQINIVAHSQGTVVTTGAVTLQPPAIALSPQVDYTLHRIFFIGANIHDAAGQTISGAEASRNQELSRIPVSRLKITNFTSESDEVVGLGWLQGAGERGFLNNAGKKTDSLFGGSVVNEDVNRKGLKLKLDDGTRKDVVVGITHTGDLTPTYGDVTHTLYSAGWWDWLIAKESNEGFLSDRIRFDSNNVSLSEHLHGAAGDVLDSGSQVGQPDPEVPVVVHRMLVASAGFDLAVGGAQYTRSGPQSGRPQSPPKLTRVDLRQVAVFQGELVIATAVGAADSDGQVMRFEAFLDEDGNAHPDPGELVAVDYNPSGGFRVAIDTRDLAFGTYTLVFRVADDEGNYSDLVTTSFQVLDPNSPPPQLPTSLPPETKPDFAIIPHRNGDVAYSEENYVIGRNHADVWQLTLPTGGGVRIQATGPTDTVLGIYDATTGELVAFDEDNGPGANGELNLTLTGGKTYFVVVAAQNGSVGHYGLNVTGPNQVIDGTLNPAAPLYTATVSGSISQPEQIRYYQITAPAGATRLDLKLDVAAGLDGFVRVEDSNHQTVATAFLAGTGSDDILNNITVTPGESYFVTVVGMYETTGDFDLNVDFSPDDPGFPTEITSVPVSELQQVITPPNGLLSIDGEIASSGEFDYYLLTPRQTGQFNFDVLGNIDTQVGLYSYNGSTNATLLATDDDSSGAGNPRLSAQLDGGSQYLLVVRADAAQTGSYQLQVGQGVLDSAGTIAIFGLESKGSGDGSYASNNRYAHYSVTAPSNATTMTVDLALLPNLSNLNAKLRVTDSAGAVIGFADVGGTGQDEHLVDLAVNPGETYTITVYGNDVTAGDYQINVDFAPDFTTNSGTEFPVAEGFGSQQFADVGRNASGQTVVVWREEAVVPHEIRFQRYGADGQPVGTVVTANSGGEPSGLPKVAVAADGTFAILWSRNSDIYLRRFDAAGNALTGEVLVSQSGTQSDEARVAVAPNNSFVVVWTSFDHGDADGGIYAQLIDANGNLVGSEIHVNTTTLKYQGGPNVVFRPDGSFLVVWHSESGSELALLAQRFTSSGTAVGSEFRINGPGRVLYPAIAVDPSGNVVVTWKNHVGSSVESIRARVLAADDSFLTDEIIVSQALTPLNFEPSVAFGPQGQFVVAWTTAQDTDGSGIAAQAFYADGSRRGPEYILNQQQSLPQTQAVLAGNGGEEIFAIWQTNKGGSIAADLRGLVFNIDIIRQPILRVTDDQGATDDYSVDFGRFPTLSVSSTRTVTLHNDGNATLDISNLEVFGADADAFTIAGPTSFSVAPGGSVAVDVTFHGGTDGAQFAGLRFVHNSPQAGSTAWVNLLAEIAQPSLQVGLTHVSVVEGAGQGLVYARVRRTNTDTGSPLSVNLSSSNPVQVSTAATAVIPAGQEFVEVPLDIRTNSSANSTLVVTITADASGLLSAGDQIAVTDVVSLSGTTLQVQGSSNADTITVTEGANLVVTVNGVNYSYDPAQVTSINVHGSGGSDTLTFTGTTGDETATLRANNTLHVAGPGYTLDADSLETIRVYGGGGTNDRAYLYDSAGNDLFAGTPTYAYLTGTGFYNYAKGFGHVSAYATAGNAGGVGDRAVLYDSAGNDLFAGTPTYAYLTGTGFENYVKGFAHVYAYATAGNAGGVGDRAVLYDSAGNDLFVGSRTYASLAGTGFENYAGGFAHVYAYAAAGNAGGVGDRAVLYDSVGNDLFVGTPTYASLAGTGFDNYAGGFAHVNAYALAGNAGGVGDRAVLYDSPGNDLFAATPTYAYLTGTGYDNNAKGFAHVNAYAMAGNAGGVGDRAVLYDSPGNDLFAATPTDAYLTGSGYDNHAKGFGHVYAYATAGNAGGVGDRAVLNDSAGNDTFVGTPIYAYLTGTGYYNYANGFAHIYAYAAAGNAGGVGDRAYFYDSAGNDTFTGTPTYAYLTGTGYYNYANGFAHVYASATAGNAGGVGDRAYFYDSAGNDTFYGRSNYGRLSGAGFYNNVQGFGSIAAFANSSGTDTLDVHDVDYLFTQFGSWENLL